MAEIGPNTRLKVSPFYQATVAENVTAFSPYNRMLMPVSYGNPLEEYDRLINGVSLWDVGVERQVLIKGKNAAELTQILSMRDLSNCKIGQGKYVPMCDHRGTLINDPVVLKFDEDYYWISIADNNMLLWTRCVAAERGIEAEIHEPDVSPMAIQGPKAEEVVASLLGDWVRDLKYFWFKETSINGIPIVVQRSGYSKQGGFELYLMDGKRGTELWNIVREAGKPWDIGPGNPSPIERIESGLLSFGGDTDDMTNPFEVRLENYTDLDVSDEVVGVKALREIHKNGIKRHQLGVMLEGEENQPGNGIWYDVISQGEKVGDMTNGTWSPRLEKFIGFVLITRDLKPGDQVTVLKEGRMIQGTLCELPFL